MKLFSKNFPRGKTATLPRGHLPITRRALLQTVGLGMGALALPTFAQFLNDSGTAHADGSPLPVRFGLWYWGCGLFPERWVPEASGADWPVSEFLTPLSDVKSYVSPISNLRVQATGSHDAMTVVLTGKYDYLFTAENGHVPYLSQPSIDQIVASAFGTQTKYRSLEVGVSSAGGNGEPIWETISSKGGKSLNPPEFDPQVVFDRLFGASVAGAQRNAATKNVLDVVNKDAVRLRARLGAADRQRLDQHLQGVSDLQRQLASGQSCTPTDRPASDPPSDKEQLAARSLAHAKLLALALSCDLTRSFSVQFSRAEHGTIFTDLIAENGRKFAATDGFHSLTHNRSTDPAIPAGMKFTMEQLAGFVRTFSQTPDGAGGNLLDHCVVMATSELADPVGHSSANLPILLIGKANGRLRSGYHYRGNDETACRAHLTVLKALGLPNTSFGTDGDQAKNAISELLT